MVLKRLYSQIFKASMYFFFIPLSNFFYFLIQLCITFPTYIFHVFFPSALFYQFIYYFFLFFFCPLFFPCSEFSSSQFISFPLFVFFVFIFSILSFFFPCFQVFKFPIYQFSFISVFNVFLFTIFYNFFTFFSVSLLVFVTISIFHFYFFFISGKISGSQFSQSLIFFVCSFLVSFLLSHPFHNKQVKETSTPTLPSFTYFLSGMGNKLDIAVP